MFQSIVLLSAYLFVLPVQEQVPQPDAKLKATREVVFEVPGITCVGRFKDSLQQAVVKKLDGVHSINFHYLDRAPDPAQQKVMNLAAARGELVFGGLGQVTFTVDRNFDSRRLIQHLKESKVYNLDRWVIVERTLLTDPRFRVPAKQP